MRKIFLGLFFIMLVSNASAQKRIPSYKPKLIVGIVVDHLRQDQIYKYWDKLGNGGIKRLYNEGAVCSFADYDYSFTASGKDHATIATGAYPAYHGIIGKQWYNRLKKKEVYCVDDGNAFNVGGLSDEGNRSPANLMGSTFADELKLFSPKSKVIGISLNDRNAILNTGNLADAVYWLEEKSGHWISSSHYIDALPGWVREINQKKLTELYLERQWELFGPLDYYSELPGDNPDIEKGFFERFNTFPYNLKSLFKENDSYKVLKATPYGNLHVKDMAQSAIINEAMGKDEFTDYLSLNFTILDNWVSDFGVVSYEYLDILLRLDKQIEDFLNFLDQEIGIENTWVYFTASEMTMYNPEYLTSNGLRAGFFNKKGAESLLNSYLMALYGQGNWIEYYKGHEIYLNRDLIEKSNLSVSEFHEKITQFLIYFTGVSNATSATSLKSSIFAKGLYEKIQNGYNQKRSGDILVYHEPGWVQEERFQGNEIVWESRYTRTPLVFWGWKTGRKNIMRPVNMTDIAPTISGVLQISPPNNCNGAAITEIF